VRKAEGRGRAGTGKRSGPSLEQPQRNPVDKAFMVLRWIVDQEESAVGVREIARGLEVSPSTVHRVLMSLESQGLVQVDSPTGRYQIGLEFMRLAWKFTARSPLDVIVRPILRELSVTTGETSFLGVYDAAKRAMLFAASVESQHELRTSIPLHTWLPLNPSASSLAILAFLPERDRAAIVRKIQNSGRTTKSRASLADDLARIRRLGYAKTVGQRNPHALGIAAPVLDAQGRVIGDVGVAVPTPRFASDDEAGLARKVKGAAQRITEQIGGRWPPVRD